MLVIIRKRHAIFKLLSFLNCLSYKHQIGLKWKIIWCSFMVFLKVSTNLMFWIQFINYRQIFFFKFSKINPFLSCFLWYMLPNRFPSIYFLKLLQIIFHLRPTRHLQVKLFRNKINPKRNSSSQNMKNSLL